MTGVTHVAKVTRLTRMTCMTTTTGMTRLTRVTGKNSELEFHILGTEIIDIVHEYTYLGTQISSTGWEELLVCTCTPQKVKVQK